MASGGMRELIPTVARTAVAAGVDGIFMEVRSQPLPFSLLANKLHDVCFDHGTVPACAF